MDQENISTSGIFKQYQQWGIDLNESRFRKMATIYKSGFELGDHLYGELPLSKRRELSFDLHDNCIKFAEILWKRLLEDEKLDLYQFWIQFEKGDTIDDPEDKVAFYLDHWNDFISFLEMEDTNTEQIIDEIAEEIDFYGNAMMDMGEILEAYTWQDRNNFKKLNRFFSSFVKYFNDYFHSNPYWMQVASYCHLRYVNGIWAKGKYREAIKRYHYIDDKFGDVGWTSYYRACCIIKDYERGKRNKAVNLHQAERLLLQTRRTIPQEEMDLFDFQDLLEKLQTCYLHLENRNKYDEIEMELKSIGKAIKEKYG